MIALADLRRHFMFRTDIPTFLGYAERIATTGAIVMLYQKTFSSQRIIVNQSGAKKKMQRSRAAAMLRSWKACQPETEREGTGYMSSGHRKHMEAWCHP